MLEKLKNLVRKYGAGGTAALLWRYARGSAAMFLGPGKTGRGAVEELLGEIRAGRYERLVLRRGSFGWHTVLFQRAQQLACAMGRRGCLVLYEAVPPHESLRGAEKLGEGLWLADLRAPRLRRLIENAARESGRPRWLMLASRRADSLRVCRSAMPRRAGRCCTTISTRSVPRSAGERACRGGRSRSTSGRWQGGTCLSRPRLLRC